MASDGIDHDLAQHGLVGAWLDVEFVAQHRQAEQHRGQDQA